MTTVKLVIKYFGLEERVDTEEYGDLRDAMYHANYYYYSKRGYPIKIIDDVNHKEYSFDEIYNWWDKKRWT